MHATQFSKHVAEARNASLIVLYGNESHLKVNSLEQLCSTLLEEPLQSAMGLVRMDGKGTDFRTVRDELLTVSMFSPRKLVVVGDADDFVSSYRSQLETLADKAPGSSKLVLDVQKWPKNTRIAKKVDKQGLAVECSELTGGKLQTWLVSQAKSEHDKKLTREAAALLPELAGTGLTLLNQELQKLSAYVGERNKIDAEDVSAVVGGWKVETTWTMINAIRDCEVDVALTCLSKLLTAGEAAPKIMGGINFVFKKYALATELTRQGRGLPAALKEAGVFPRDISASESYLRRIRRGRAEQILQKLAVADSDLKGGSRLPDRLQMERLVLWLAGVAD